MSQQFQFLDIIFLGIIVLLLINRLRSVLGTRPSSDESVDKTQQSSQNSKIVDISEYRTIENETGAKLEHDLSASAGFEEDSEVIQNLKKIKVSHSHFLRELIE